MHGSSGGDQFLSVFSKDSQFSVFQKLKEVSERQALLNCAVHTRRKEVSGTPYILPWVNPGKQCPYYKFG